MLFLACQNRPLFNPYFDSEFSGRMKKVQAQDVGFTGVDFKFLVLFSGIGRFAIMDCYKDGHRKPETFNFLGFAHYCTKACNNGWFVIARKTIKKKMRAQLKSIKTELRRRINRPIIETGAWLHRVLTGHLNYSAVPGNGKSISSFFYRVSWCWLRQLHRRSQRHRMTWERFGKIRARFFPPVKIIYPHPLHRFDAKTQGRSPVR